MERSARHDAALDIVYVGTYTPHQGGASVAGVQIVRGLVARGHAVRVLTPVTREVLARTALLARRDPNVPVTDLMVPSLERLPEGPEPNEYPDEYARLETVEMERALERLIDQRRPDLLMIGRETLVRHVIGSARGLRLPTVLLVHNTTNVRFLEHGVPVAAARIAREQFSQPSMLIAVATHLGQRVRALGFSNLQVIENTVDSHLFAPRLPDPALARNLEIGPRDVVVAHLSNLKGWKRPLDLVYSAQQALQRDPRLVYLVVGDGQLRLAMEDACRQSGVMHRFRFTGWVDRASVPAYLQLADLVAMPSETEARALVYLETQACGRLLVASDVAAAREVIQDGETGLLFRKGDIDDLTAKTLLAAGDAGLRARIGAQARRAAEARSHDAMIDAYEATLQAVSRRSEHQESQWERERV